MFKMQCVIFTNVPHKQISTPGDMITIVTVKWFDKEIIIPKVRLKFIIL